MSHHESAAKGPEGRMVDRMLFFSDAVFAIVLTIMVLELRAPNLSGAVGPHGEAVLWNALGEMIEEFAAFIISFLLVGGWWLIHMRATQRLRVFDWPTAVANLFFLFTISLVPFGASVFGADIAGVASIQVYWSINAANSAAMTLLFVVSARGKGRLVGGLEPGEWTFRFIQSIAPGIAFVAGVWLAAVGRVDLSRFCWVLILPAMAMARLARVLLTRNKPARA